jgi:hypothetical protein
MDLTIKNQSCAFLLLITKEPNSTGQIIGQYRDRDEAITQLTVALCEGIDADNPDALELLGILNSAVRSVELNFPELKFHETPIGPIPRKKGGNHDQKNN